MSVSAFLCHLSAAIGRGGEILCQWRSFIGMAGRSASMLNLSSCSFHPVYLWNSHVASSIKKKKGGGRGEMSYSCPGRGSVDPLSGVLSANIEHGQG